MEEKIKTEGYRIIFVDENGNRKTIGSIKDKDEFIERANLSKIKDEESDTTVWLVPIEVSRVGGTTIDPTKIQKREIYFGKRENIKINS